MANHEISIIFDHLKNHLKTKHISYCELADRLKMSESNVKRIFSSKSCTLLQVTEICKATDISFTDLMAIVAKSKSPEFVLPNEAEEYFLKNFECFIFYRNLSLAKNAQHFITESKISKTRITTYLAALEKFKLIKRNRNGYVGSKEGYLSLSQCPRLEQYLKEQWVPWFIDKLLKEPHDSKNYIKISSTGLSEVNRTNLLHDLEALAKKYKDLGYQDQIIKNKVEPIGICMAVGPHRVGFFED